VQFDAPEVDSEGQSSGGECSDFEREATLQRQRTGCDWSYVKAKVDVGRKSGQSSLKDLHSPTTGCGVSIISEKLQWNVKARVDARNPNYRPPETQVKIVNEKPNFTHVRPKVDTGIHHNSSAGDLQSTLSSPSFRLRSPGKEGTFSKIAPSRQQSAPRVLDRQLSSPHGFFGSPSRGREGAMLSFTQFMEMAAHKVPDPEALFKEMDVEGHGEVEIGQCLAVLFQRMAAGAPSPPAIRPLEPLQF